MPWKSWGWDRPWGVENVRSATVGVELGLNIETSSTFPLVVTPDGKYHCAAVRLAQAAADQPFGPCTDWETMTPPPFTRTSTASQLPCSMDVGWTTVWAFAARGTSVAPRVPVSVTTATEASAATAPVLVRTIELLAAPEALPVAPTQYQVDDWDPAGAINAAGEAGAAAIPDDTAWSTRPRTTRKTSTRPRAIQRRTPAPCAAGVDETRRALTAPPPGRPGPRPVARGRRAARSGARGVPDGDAEDRRGGDDVRRRAPRGPPRGRS